MSETNEQPGDGESASPVLDGRRLLRVHRRRLEQIRAEQARLNDESWRNLFRQLEHVLRRVFSNPRLMADAEIDRICRRMMRSADMETLTFELRQLAERLTEIAGARPVAICAGRTGPDDSKGPAELRQPNGRMRLRL